MRRSYLGGSTASALLVGLLTTSGIAPAGAQEQPPPSATIKSVDPHPAIPVAAPAPSQGEKTLPINLPSALQLANVRPIDVAVATERIRLAAAELERARVLWLPTIQLGTDYFRHDGRIQNVEGRLFDTSRSTFMVGAAPIAVFGITDAIFAPLSARQVRGARESDLQAALNNSLLAVAETYFNVQQARGELGGAEDALRRATELSRRADELAPGLLPQVEAVRVRTELSRRRQAVHAARERWRVASAELVRILRLDASALLEPLEPPHLQVTLVGLDKPVDDLIPVGLLNRPELASQQALVQATLERLRAERLRPVVPSVLLRGAATNPAGTLAGGVFGGGNNASMGNFAARGDFDIQVLWELQNLGFGNRARVEERRGEHRIAHLELFRTQDRVAAEVAQALAQAQSAAARAGEAEVGLRDAIDSAEKNFEGLGQTKRLSGNLLTLVIRPQEAVAAIQALSQAYADYYGSVNDYNRAQFRLYRALGQPAQWLTGPTPSHNSPEPTLPSHSTEATPAPPSPTPLRQ